MRFGVGLFTLQSSAMSPRHHVRAYRELREDAQLIEGLGFDGIWLSEHHFFYDGYCPALLPAAASALAVTRRLRVGTGTLLLPLQDPERVARMATDLALRSGNRFDLGLGLGYRDVEFDAKGVPRRDRVERLERGLRALAPASVSGVPLWIGSAVRAGISRAGAHGLPILLSGALPLPMVADLVATHRAGWEQAGRPGGRRPAVAALRNIWVTEDGAERQAVLDWVRASYVLYAGLGWSVPAEGDREALDFVRKTDEAIRASVATTIIGPSHHVLKELARLEGLGVDYVVCRVMLEGAPREAIHSVLRRIARHVLPAMAGAVVA